LIPIKGIHLDNNILDLKNLKVAVIGLGYVGLPLAVEFSKKYPTLGFDINEARVRELNSGFDCTGEVDNAALVANKFLEISSDPEKLADANFYIVAVPTPIDRYNRPDLRPLEVACHSLGARIKPGNIIVFESTVYPGVTEDYCAPIIESVSGLNLNNDDSQRGGFYLGYSPERINPGDKTRGLTDIVKVTSGSTPMAAEFISIVYGSIIKAGIHKASSIRVAEAAKVIENAQRDVNIAFVNELAVLFSKINLSTHEVLEAAGTKWNFLNFRPGLVGGHCIGVDPYYLAHMAQAEGVSPEVIIAGRRTNDRMAEQLVINLIRESLRRATDNVRRKALICGVTFKENCPDIRNSKVFDFISHLQNFGFEVSAHDPIASIDEVRREYAVRLLTSVEAEAYAAECDVIALLVPHEQYDEPSVRRLLEAPSKKRTPIFFDLKAKFYGSDIVRRNSHYLTI
jgi:UDP-N-acetyl-D-glucosamine/UDP-N-acetyl-D-galactosamine dehydrogenase